MKKYDASTKVVAGFVPIDLASGAQLGDWVSVKDYDSLTVLYISDVGVAGQDVTVKLQQATDNANAGVKDLDAGQWFQMQHATALTDVFIKDGTAGEFEDDGETRCIAPHRGDGRPARCGQ